MNDFHRGSSRGFGASGFVEGYQKCGVICVTFLQGDFYMWERVGRGSEGLGFSQRATHTPSDAEMARSLV